ncbi:aminoacyl-histidine dipeptidase [Clostridiaceae bacterium M8S5]|nr:aminoacyl-histidine dipeptidase [Clostridiaceae bacterium M8S5]
MEVLKGLKPEDVFKYFEEISNIPRCSGDEKRISDYLVKFAIDNGLDFSQEECLNVIIRKPATKGYENAPTVILQGHMDMVCEKNNDCVHNFCTDPLKLLIDGDMVKAQGTTLGADNGIAVAYGLAILADKTLEHPAIEVLITSDEESGMTGVMNLNPEDIKGTTLINLDSEEEGEFCVSCAGGVSGSFYIKADYVDVDSKYDEFYSVKIRGLKGGHSGADIDKGRANSHKLMARVLDSFDFDYTLADIKGGAKANAIPREADAVIGVNAGDKTSLELCVKKCEETFKNEFSITDSDVKVVLKPVSKPEKTFTSDVKNKVIALITTVINGIQTMSMSIENLVESSTSLGVVVLENDNIEFRCALRSSVDSLKEYMVKQMKRTADLVGAEFIASDGYPGWEYKEDSKIREICIETYKNMYHKEPKVMAIHAGLECGFLKEKLGDIDMISIGPDLFDVHTPDECISISSVERTYTFLKEVLKNIK